VGNNFFSRTTDGTEVLLAGYECGNYLWKASTDKFTQGPGLVSGSSAASGNGYWFASDYSQLDSTMIPLMVAQVPEFFSLLRVNTDYSGEKMNALGSLLYTPVQ
jgi:hypothetical protein